MAYENTKNRLRGDETIAKGVQNGDSPTEGQKTKIIRSIGVARFLYNQYIAYNRCLYKMYQRGMLDENRNVLLLPTILTSMLIIS